MNPVGAINSPRELLAVPEVQEAKAIELSICDIMHYQLLEPWAVFELVEALLVHRHGDLFEGFAQLRAEVDQRLRGASIHDKIDACCTRNNSWLDHRMVLYCTELEVWMELSYPNMSALELYHEALMAGKEVVVRNLGPFSDGFFSDLKTKNGFERTLMENPGAGTVAIHIGEQSWLKVPYLHLLTDYSPYGKKTFADSSDLAGHLAYGIQMKDMEDLAAGEPAPSEARAHALGHQLIGPGLLILVQNLIRTPGPVAFCGLGADMLTGLVNEVRNYWPSLPQAGAPDEAVSFLSLLPDPAASHSLFPEENEPAILNWPEDCPGNLLGAPTRMLIEAAFKGAQHDAIGQSAAKFVRQFTLLTRGLQVHLSGEAVLQEWCRWILAPSQDWLNWAGEDGHLPGFQGRRRLLTGLRNGPWPSGSYYTGGNFRKKWMRFRQKEQVLAIEASQAKATP